MSKKLDAMTAAEFIRIAKDKYPNNVFHSMLEDVAKDIDGEENFIHEYYKKWTPIFAKFDEVAKKLKYVHVYLWMTDCDDNRASFGEFFYKNNYEVEETFICADITVDYSDEWLGEQKIVNAFFANPYDNDGKKDAFWRDDFLKGDEDIDDFLKTLVKIDKMIEVYRS